MRPSTSVCGRAHEFQPHHSSGHRRRFRQRRGPRRGDRRRRRARGGACRWRAAGGGHGAAGRGDRPRSAQAGRAQISGDPRPRQYRARRGPARLRGGGRDARWQFRNEVAMAHAATAAPLAVRRGGGGRHLHRPGRACRPLPGRSPPPRTGSASITSTATRRRIGEGYNMQQVPKPEQGTFGRLTAVMGGATSCTRRSRSARRCAAAPHRPPSLQGRPLLPADADQHPAGDGDDQPCRHAAGARHPAGGGSRSGDLRQCRGAHRRPRAHRHQGRRRRPPLRRAHPRARRAGQRRGRAVAGLARRAARCASAEHACRWVEGLDQRQLRHERGRPSCSRSARAPSASPTARASAIRRRARSSTSTATSTISPTTPTR